MANTILGRQFAETNSTVGIKEFSCDVHYAKASEGDKRDIWAISRKPEKEFETALGQLLAEEQSFADSVDERERQDDDNEVDAKLVMKCLKNKVETPSGLIISIFDFGGQSIFNVSGYSI